MARPVGADDPRIMQIYARINDGSLNATERNAAVREAQRLVAALVKENGEGFVAEVEASLPTPTESSTKTERSSKQTKSRERTPKTVVEKPDPEEVASNRVVGKQPKAARLDPLRERAAKQTPGRKPFGQGQGSDIQRNKTKRDNRAADRAVRERLAEDRVQALAAIRAKHRTFQNKSSIQRKYIQAAKKEVALITTTGLLDNALQALEQISRNYLTIPAAQQQAVIDALTAPGVYEEVLHRAALAGQQALVDAYDRDFVPHERAGSVYLAGVNRRNRLHGKLRKALVSSAFFAVSGDGARASLEWGLASHLDKAAAHWRRVTFGAGGGSATDIHAVNLQLTRGATVNLPFGSGATSRSPQVRVPPGRFYDPNGQLQARGTQGSGGFYPRLYKGPDGKTGFSAFKDPILADVAGRPGYFQKGVEGLAQAMTTELNSVVSEKITAGLQRRSRAQATLGKTTSARRLPDAFRVRPTFG